MRMMMMTVLKMERTTVMAIMMVAMITKPKPKTKTIPVTVTTTMTIKLTITRTIPTALTLMLFWEQTWHQHQWQRQWQYMATTNRLTVIWTTMTHHDWWTSAHAKVRWPGAGASAVLCSSCRRRLSDGTAVEVAGRRKMLPYTVKSTGKDPVAAQQRVSSCLQTGTGIWVNPKISSQM